ncbi:MAG TPA: ATP-binding protein [Bacteroidales bacterium]|nr:ATP-binding protein [Bacteroidales bacterium]
MTIHSDISNISLVEKLIDELSQQYSFHSDVYGKLLLAVVEGVNNAIVHGNKMVSEKKVTISYEVASNRISFTIRDEGQGFDHTLLPDPTTPENIERTHGRGVFLMKHLTDELAFSDKGNEVKLTFKF